MKWDVRLNLIMIVIAMFLEYAAIVLFSVSYSIYLAFFFFGAATETILLRYALHLKLKERKKHEKK